LQEWQASLQLVGSKTTEEEMAHEKRFMAWKRHHRKRKSAKAKMKLYEQGKLTHDKLPALAKEFLRRKTRSLSKAE
jgi:hypothetical protein